MHTPKRSVIMLQCRMPTVAIRLCGHHVLRAAEGGWCSQAEDRVVNAVKTCTCYKRISYTHSMAQQKAETLPPSKCPLSFNRRQIEVGMQAVAGMHVLEHDLKISRSQACA